jgi:outer membrane protein OmpA-like peptidoglycan-associated protein
MEVLATDADGFTAGVQLFPWYYEIPHEDVVFESNQAVIRPSEEMKLRSALAEAQKVVARYGAFATVNLYVGGYTDTVGNGQSNLFLSEKRAAAIARWFRQNGFQGEIWFQGFGERGLAVPTPDEVDEARNRRSVYVVAAEPPPVTSAMPGAEWKKL